MNSIWWSEQHGNIFEECFSGWGSFEGPLTGSENQPQSGQEGLSDGGARTDVTGVLSSCGP